MTENIIFNNEIIKQLIEKNDILGELAAITKI